MVTAKKTLHPAFWTVMTRLEADEQDHLQKLTRGNWDRVLFAGDVVMVLRGTRWHDSGVRLLPPEEPQKPEPTSPPQLVVVESAPTPVVAPRIWCARCQKDGHYVEDCPHKTIKAAREARRAEIEAITAQAPVVQQRVTVPPLRRGEVTDSELTAHSASLLDLCSRGLPEHLEYSFKPDVLALYGIDFDLLDAVLRHPERVELRPESFNKDKRYTVLAFYRGDLEVILGMKHVARPAVIAAYASSRLEHDTHRVGHTGGGGSRKTSGLPSSPKQMATRLRAIGCEVEIDERQKTAPVTYKGQELGRVTCQGLKETVQSDYQRIVRKVAAIDQRATA